MEAITTKEKLPKFLMVNEKPEKKTWNKYLLKPFVKGEIVKVAPFEEQKRNSKYDDKFQNYKPNTNPEHFRERYVVVYRKDDEGKWSLKYSQDWGSFDLLKSKK